MGFCEVISPGLVFVDLFRYKLLNLSIILETDRLLLRQPTMEDASFMLRLVNEPTWLQYIGDRNVHSLEDAKQYLFNGSIKSFTENNFGFGIVVLKESGDLLGMCGLLKRDFLEDVDLGFAFFPEYTRKGYAYEAAAATVIHARDVLGIKSLAAIATQDNLSSIKLLKKLGFEIDGTVMHEGEELFLFRRESR